MIDVSNEKRPLVENEEEGTVFYATLKPYDLRERCLVKDMVMKGGGSLSGFLYGERYRTFEQAKAALLKDLEEEGEEKLLKRARNWDIPYDLIKEENGEEPL